MVKGIESGKRQYETGWYQHNNCDDKRTSQKDPKLRVTGSRN